MASSHRYITAAELSRQLDVSPHRLLRLVSRGEVPKCDIFIAGREAWNADKVSAIRAALSQAQEVEV